MNSTAIITCLESKYKFGFTPSLKTCRVKPFQNKFTRRARPHQTAISAMWWRRWVSAITKTWCAISYQVWYVTLSTSCGVSVFKMSVVCSAAWFCCCRRHAAVGLNACLIYEKRSFLPKGYTNRLSRIKWQAVLSQMFSIRGPVASACCDFVYHRECEDENKIDVKMCMYARIRVWAE